jgi:hypothetical protein
MPSFRQMFQGFMNYSTECIELQLSQNEFDVLNIKNGRYHQLEDFGV